MIRNLYKNEQRDKKWALRIIKNIKQIKQI